MAAELPPKRSSSQSSRFKSAATTVVAAGRLRRTVGSAFDAAVKVPLSSKQAASSSGQGAASTVLANPSSFVNTNTVNSNTKRSIYEATSSSSQSNDNSSSAIVELGHVFIAQGSAEVTNGSTTANRITSLSPNNHPSVEGEDGANENNTSKMEAGESISAALVSGAISAGPGEVADVYDEERTWFVPANTKLHTGSKLFWRIKRTIDFKLYV